MKSYGVKPSEIHQIAILEFYVQKNDGRCVVANPQDALSEAKAFLVSKQIKSTSSLDIPTTSALETMFVRICLSHGLLQDALDIVNAHLPLAIAAQKEALLPANDPQLVNNFFEMNALLIEHHIKLGDVQICTEIFSVLEGSLNIPQHFYHKLISALFVQGHYEDALEVFKFHLQVGCEQTNLSLFFLGIQACRMSNNLEQAQEIFHKANDFVCSQQQKYLAVLLWNAFRDIEGEDTAKDFWDSLTIPLPEDPEIISASLSDPFSDLSKFKNLDLAST
eukprot:CAMPEP_0184345610 /NCGR_PEP_ID=MMETSP1089-20130417/13991_1 /TAXON_ID=38269 ORGANISM="Gloeochaete wittrockiana, Strain SAG46.84" /NCGR_SAMPLE_ID=MMETSP1089 /ASSEMBLY_ACC=CAM_ASM_000445 /LENGTH=277 /DNA_ID=CAMNT_0026675967 /DNA_START=24 /DNA_END=853 /DNA_ORIENTATION=-